ncbi:MAG: ATP-binding cassette domain-containing protein [Mesorhizobium sp.]
MNEHPGNSLDAGWINRPGMTLERVCIAINGRRLVDLSATVAPGEIVTIMGASGSGKSTLLAYIAGFLDPAFAARGNVILDGQSLLDIPTHERHLGLMLQDDLLFPHLSVAGNLAFGLPRDAVDRQGDVATALEEMEMAGFGNRDPATLSGGQRARVSLMRTLLARPRALLLDEPFSKLDRELRIQVRKFVFDTVRKRALPVLLVTHDTEDAEQAQGTMFSL